MNLDEKINKTRKRRRILVAICFVCAFLILGGTAAWVAYNSYLETIDAVIRVSDSHAKEELEEVLDTPEPPDNEKYESVAPFYTLIVGSDQRDDEASRSDVMILARVAPDDKQITMVSLPRDIMVDLDEYGTQKLNAAYTFGGVKGTINAVKDICGVPISHYVEVHFDETIQAIDELGGIDVDVPVSNDETGMTEIGIIESGMQHLDGETALAFARERYGYARGDFQRADNQRLIVAAVVNKVLEQPVYEIPDTVTNLVKCVTTDMKASDILSMAMSMRDTDELTIYSAIAPCSTAMIGGVSYDVLDEDGLTEMIELMNEGKDPSSAQSGASSPDAAIWL